MIVLPLNAYRPGGNKFTIKLLARASGAARVQDAESFIRVDCNDLGWENPQGDESNPGNKYHTITVFPRRRTTPRALLYPEPRKPVPRDYTYPAAYQRPDLDQ